MNKKYVKITAVILTMVIGALAYYYYLSNKTPSSDATDQSVTNQEVAELITRDLQKNYPESPKEVIKFYMRIAKQYYNTDNSEETVEKLGKQARLLFDDELKSKQTDEQFLTELKKEVKEYKKANRYISDYQIDTSNSVKYQTLENREYASIMTLYYIREKNNLIYSYTKFRLRKDDSGRWKILYWELSDEDQGSTSVK